MSVIVAGTVRVAAAELARAAPRMAEMIAASRAEEGCLEYAYAQDVGDPGVIRVFEIWGDEVALRAHFASAHMARWRAALADLGVKIASDRRISVYEIAAERAI